MHRRWLQIVLLVALAALGGGSCYWLYSDQREALIEQASMDLVEARHSFVLALAKLFEPAPLFYRTVRDSGIEREPADDVLELFRSLAAGPVLYFGQLDGAFLGFPDGRFVHVQDLEYGRSGQETGVTARRGLVLTSRFVTVGGDTAVDEWEVYDPERKEWTALQRPAEDFDPRSRPWYKAAVKAGGPTWTEPYHYASSGVLGVTFAQPIFDETGEVWAVVGVDLSLESLSRSLVEAAEVLEEVGDVIFATDLGDRILGHPSLIADPASLHRQIKEHIEKFNRPDSLESQIKDRVNDPNLIAVVSVLEASYLATMAKLDPTKAMPMHVYIAREMGVVLEEAIDSLRRNVLLLFATMMVFVVLFGYALKLRTEVGARLEAEAGLIEARDAAEAATAAKSAFLATMSHEIRTPMSGVMSMAELLTLTRLDAEQRNLTKVIQGSAAALLTIINDILDFSKIEAGKLEVERIEFSLMEVVSESAELLAAKSDERGLDLVTDLDPGLVDRRIGDPIRIRQILLNLGGNAVKFTEKGQVTVTVREVEDETGRLRFEVRDTGIGLTPEQQERLFEPFVQADGSTSRKFGGTGLGLSICRRLTELMGGRIGVESVSGKGSTFWFELPLEAVGEAPPRYDGDLSRAHVHLVGLPDEVAAIAERYLRATGVTKLDRSDEIPDAGGAGADLWLIHVGTGGVGQAAFEALRGSVALVGRRAVLGSLPGRLRRRATALIALPLSRLMLWRAVAIALGLEQSDDLVAETRHDLAFAPPDANAARAAEALILVAEDNETNQLVIRQMLNRMGFACEIADNGRFALSMLEQEGYGLLLSDVNMPEMDGYALAGEIRRREAGREGERGQDRHLPIIALTADALPGTEEACLEAGMDGFLTKPIDSRKLGQVLARFLPQALPLRRAADQPGDVAAEPAMEIDWDRDIFDPMVLGGPAGGLDREARELLASAAESWQGKLDDIGRALGAGDSKKARSVAHSLKGAALSIGANRLGNLAAELQDALDSGDIGMAAIYAEVLQPTLNELNDILPRVLRG